MSKAGYSKRKCDYCQEEKSVKLAQGVSLRGRLFEEKIRKAIESRRGKTFAGFPHICAQCRKEIKKIKI